MTVEIANRVKWCASCLDWTSRYANGRCRPCRVRWLATPTAKACIKASEAKRNKTPARKLQSKLHRGTTGYQVWLTAYTKRPEVKARAQERDRVRYATNPHRKAQQKEADRKRAFSPKRLVQKRAQSAIRRALKLQQVCHCCTALDIRRFYENAPQGYEVDHKWPLALGGLHCVKNLEALTQEAHRMKTFGWDAPLIATARRITCPKPG